MSTNEVESIEVELFGVEINNQRIVYIDKDEELMQLAHLLLPGSFGFIYKKKVQVGCVYRYGVRWYHNQTWLSVPKREKEGQK